VGDDVVVLYLFGYEACEPMVSSLRGGREYIMVVYMERAAIGAALFSGKRSAKQTFFLESAKFGFADRGRNLRHECII